MTWGPRGPQGQHGVETTETTETTEETTETTAMGTTWGPSGGYGDDVGTTGMMWGCRGRCGDHGDNMGWRPRKQQRRPQRPQP